MPDGDIDLGYAIGLPPERAIAYFEERGKDIRVIGNWREMWQQAHARAFTVANGLKPEIVKDIYDDLDKALKKGLTERQFIEGLEPKLKARGWWGLGTDEQGNTVQLGSPHRLKTIYHTNMQVTYAAAHYESDMAAVDDAPYWRYDALNDARTRPSHAALDNLVFRYDDPFWETHYPPNGFNCRCMVRSLTEDDMEDKGLTVTDGSKYLEPKEPRPGGPLDPGTGELPAETPVEFRMGDRVMTPDPGWNYNPASAGLGTLQKVNIRKMEKNLNWPELPEAVKAAEQVARQSVTDGIRSDHFKHFINKSIREDDHHWPVAIMSPARVQQLGLPKNARVVQLSSQSVNNYSGSHRQHWVNEFKGGEWELVQELIESGDYKIEPKGEIVLTGKAGGKPYRLVIKGASGGEIYIVTYHRLADR